ncbi:unnamed protein product [Prorocentrum cordatum]|uniref:Uncharacterized protein n=1 Tax=Prorocentrum cordatum TaxID=2364126 RepID=A0ABN9SJ39_9DINO|nr:unnamed protein product [Polarella glacialis]
MLETIRPQQCDESGNLIFGELLRWADLATCASAEAHTRSNCVTGEVTDLVLEEGVIPRSGDTVELTAQPVLVGNTSLVVELHVRIEKSQGDASMKRWSVCTVQFTYITMKGPSGERPKCPPLEGEEATFLSAHRRDVLKKKGAIVRQLEEEPLEDLQDKFQHLNVSKDAVRVRDTVQLTIELVLPPHTNHMNNTFGGQVMYWMHKAARITALRHASIRNDVLPGVVWTTSVEGVRFEAASKASDHLVFKTFVRRVYLPNHVVVSVKVSTRSIADGTEKVIHSAPREHGYVRRINTAIFHMKVFADRVGGTPFGVAEVAPDTEQKSELVEFHEIQRRLEITRACASMTSFKGGALPWLEALAVECEAATIDSVLRLVEGTARTTWKALVACEQQPGVDVAVSTDVFGQRFTAFHFTISCQADAGSVFRKLSSLQRHQWDEKCEQYTVEKQLSPTADLVHMVVQVPHTPRVLDCAPPRCMPFLLGVRGQCAACLPSTARVRRDISLLRAWKQTSPGSYVMASRSVDHPHFKHVTRVAPPAVTYPSGFVVSQCHPRGSSLHYIVVMENEVFRSLGAKTAIPLAASMQSKSLLKLRHLLDANES